MMHIVRTFSRMLGLATLIALLAACGGGGGSDNSATVVPPVGGGNPPVITPEVIEGVATPSSVSVVTATNAN